MYIQCLPCNEVYQNLQEQYRSKRSKATGDRRLRDRALVASEKYIKNYIRSLFGYFSHIVCFIVVVSWSKKRRYTP